MNFPEKQKTLAGLKQWSFLCAECEQYDGDDFSSISVNSSSLKELEFSRVNFERSDFFGTKWISSKFMSVHFESSDINSIWASNCVFENVAFDSVSLTDSSFVDCQFVSCTFNFIGLTNNQFVRCSFDGLALTSTTTILNTFSECSFCNATIAKSFYYQIFESCVFDNSTIEARLLGFNYGISCETIPYVCPYYDEAMIRNTFSQNQQLINIAIFSINLAQEGMLDIAFLAIMYAVSQLLRQDFLVKSDEFAFFIRLLEHFDKGQSVAPITLYQCFQETYSLLKMENKNVAVQKSADNLNLLQNKLFFMLQRFIEKLQEQNHLMESDAKITIQILYYQKPMYPLTNILSLLSQQGQLSLPDPVLQRTAEGSFVEWIETYGAIVPFLQCFISLLGVIVPIVVKSRKSDDEKAKAKKDGSPSTTNVTIVNQTAIYAPTIIAQIGTVITPASENMVNQTAQVINVCQLLSSADFMGCNSKNIKDIQVQYSL